MKLENLLRPVKYVDEQVLKHYTEISEGWSDRKLYGTAMGLDIFSYVSFISINFGFAGNFLSGGIIGTSFVYDMCGFGILPGIEKDETTGETFLQASTLEIYQRFHKISRLPLFTAGCALVGRTIYDVANYFFNGEPLTNETFSSATGGAGFLSLASSMYLKDRDPKLLDKIPLWKKALNYLGERTKIKVPSLEKAR